MARSLSLLALIVVASCVADRTPSHAGEPSTDEDAAASVVVPDEPADAEVTPSMRSDASLDASSASDAGSVATSDAKVADAQVEEPPKPLVVKGVRKCDEQEAKNEVCFEKRKAGMCLDGYCVTETVCPRYCAARGAYEYADCPIGDPKECQGVPECLQVLKQARAACANIKKQVTDDCLRLTCANVRIMPAPP